MLGWGVFLCEFPSCLPPMQRLFFLKKNPVEHACRMKKALYFIFSLTSSGILSIFIFFEIQLHMDDNGLHHKNTGWIRESWVNCWASHLLQWWKICLALLVKLHNDDNTLQNMKEKVYSKLLFQNLNLWQSCHDFLLASKIALLTSILSYSPHRNLENLQQADRYLFHLTCFVLILDVSIFNYLMKKIYLSC